MPVFYTQKEAAEYLRCSEKTILSARGSEERCRSSSSAITLKFARSIWTPCSRSRRRHPSRHSVPGCTRATPIWTELPAALMRPVRKSAFAE